LYVCAGAKYLSNCIFQVQYSKARSAGTFLQEYIFLTDGLQSYAVTLDRYAMSLEGLLNYYKPISALKIALIALRV
jgi:hypothetical protein